MAPWHTMFREGDGNVSMARVCLFLMTVGFLGVWIGLSIRHGCVEDVPWGMVAVFGVPYGLKFGQMPHESDGPPPGDK